MLHSIDMNHDEGNWGIANLLVSPADDTTLKFHVNYDYSEMKVTWEEYKGALWNREMQQRAASLLSIPPDRITARISSNNSLAFNSMSLPYHVKFGDVVKYIKKPRLALELKITSPDFTAVTLKIADTACSMMDAGFEKITVKAELNSGKGNTDTLKFKITKKNNTPAATDLKKLFQKTETATFQNAGDIYKEALELLSQGNNEKALQPFMAIVKEYDNPYRFDGYIPLESHYVIESAFRAAEILDKAGRNSDAKKLYRLIADRLEYHEVKAELNEIYRTAMERLAGDKK